jgi:hypothetical protein
MDVDTYIFGYSDADKRDEVVLCALCGGQYFKVTPKVWRILRTADAAKYPSGRKCDQCDAQVYSPSGPDRLEVFAKFVETLEF